MARLAEKSREMLRQGTPTSRQVTKGFAQQKAKRGSTLGAPKPILFSQQNGPEYLYEALDFVAQGKVKPIVETYPLAEAAKAYERVAEGRARFRAVLTM